MTASEIIKKYKVPAEYTDIVFMAYSAGMDAAFEATEQVLQRVYHPETVNSNG